MKAVQVTKFDAASPFSNIAVVETDIPKPGPGEVVVQIKLRPANPADVFSVMGVYPGFQPKSLPATFGLEGVGIVSELGSGATRFKAGDRVVFVQSPASLGRGTYQEYLAVPQDYLAPVPGDVSDEAAAMALINPVTVLGMMEAVAVPQGEYLLVTAAGSALGRQVISYCRHVGVKTIGTVRRAEQVAEIKAEGADEVVCTADDSWVAKVKEITGGRGAYAALECIGGAMINSVSQALRSHGTIVLYGAMAGMEFTGSVADVLFRYVNIRGFWLNIWLEEMSVEKRQAVMARVMELYQKKVWTPFVGQTLPLAQAAQALQESAKDARGGKVLVASQ